MIVVFDSNVVIPLILDASRSTRIFRRLRAAGHKVGVSESILAEVADKLRTRQTLRAWLDLPDARIEEFVGRLPTLFVITAGSLQLHGAVPLDSKDDKIIAAAIESGAEYIVSEDKHVLALREFKGIRILTRDAFAAELDRLGVPQVDPAE